MAYSVAEVQAKIAELQAQPYQVGYENAWTDLFREVQEGGGAGWLVQQAHMQAKNQFWANQPAGSRQAGGVVWAPDPDNPGEYVNTGGGVGGAVSLGGAGGAGGVGGDATPEGGRRELELIYGWLPPDAIDVLLGEYIESGNLNAAWAQVRKDPRYAQWFPGNLTEDGRPRYSEDVYAAVVASYDDVFRSVGIDGAALDAMRQQYGTLVEGDVSPQELEANRVVPMYDRIVTSSDAIRSFYASEFGVDLGLTELMVAAMNPDLGEKVLTKQISFAEIGGEAAESGYRLDPNMLTKLTESGKVDREAADKLFQSAENLLPALSVLAKRHADPDDEFDINEFIQADVFQDPTQRRRMNRLFAQERSTFTGGGGIDYLRSQKTGGVAGLGRS